MYGLPKIHKTLINNFLKLRLTISVINIASYGWPLVPLFKCLTINKNTLKDSLEFGYDITNQSAN